MVVGVVGTARESTGARGALNPPRWRWKRALLLPNLLSWLEYTAAMRNLRRKYVVNSLQEANGFLLDNGPERLHRLK